MLREVRVGENWNHVHLGMKQYSDVFEACNNIVTCMCYDK